MVIHIFVNIAVFLTFDLVFAGYHHAASAVEKPAKCLRLIFGFMPWSSSLLQYFLHSVKKFLCNDWVMFAFMYFFGITKMSVVKRVGKQIFYSVFMPYFAAFCCNFLLFSSCPGKNVFFLNR